MRYLSQCDITTFGKVEVGTVFATGCGTVWRKADALSACKVLPTASDEAEDIADAMPVDRLIESQNETAVS